MDKAADGRSQRRGSLTGEALRSVFEWVWEGRQCQVEGSLAALRPPVLAGAPAGLKPLELATRGGVLLLPSSPASLADAGGNDCLRDEVVCKRGRGPITRCIWGSNGYPGCPSHTHLLLEQGQEIARTLPSRQRAREHQPLLRARHPHVQQAPALGLETCLQLLRHVHPAQRAAVAQPQAQDSR